MLVIKIVDRILYLVSEFIYMVLYFMAVVCHFIKVYRYAIVTFILLAVVYYGGLYGYCVRMVQIYGI